MSSNDRLIPLPQLLQHAIQKTEKPLALFYAVFSKSGDIEILATYFTLNT